LPQALKIYKNKSAKNISIITYLTIEFGVIVWIFYGLELKSFPIVIPNILSFVMTTLVLLGYFLYREKK
jgi:MtN3 and saliva related transmembrane protein